ncbi:MAG: hypothetical protein QW677_06315 [Pyrobaculum sp.]|nr:SAM-dependent methyltransferase [Pyrobaculum arsenaticum]
MPIYVVEAGPGDPSLLTLKSVELQSKVDVVAFGDLVPEEIPPRNRQEDTDRVSVGVGRRQRLFRRSPRDI